MLINNYVNIGIVTFNRLEFTRQAIASIVKYTSYPYVITVVDNDSNDGTKEYLQELQKSGLVKNVILLESNVGVAKASNIAWSQEPKSLYYIKYDNDIIIQKNNWLSGLVSVIDAVPEIGAIGYNFEQKSYESRVINGCKVRIKEEGNIGGACFLIPKRTHDLLGYWCEDYGLYGFEDCDYSLRIKLSGLLNAYMEDENIGIHLPAGKAPVVNGTTWQTSDGIEEVKYQTYRNFKDDQMKTSIGSGMVRKKFDDYQNQRCSLYIPYNTSVTKLKLATKQTKELPTNIDMQANQASSKIMRIDLGCGISKSDDFIGVDVSPGIGVDIVADLNQTFPFEDNSVDEIKAYDVVEHLHDRLHTMNEIWRICKPGALVDIFVPSTDGRGAFQDPTHVSFWNINSFFYYCSEFPAYLELCRRYGFKGEFKIVHLDHQESGNMVIHVKAKLQVVKPWSNLNEISNLAGLVSDRVDQKSDQNLFCANADNLIQHPIDEFIHQIYAQIKEYQKDSSSRTTIANIRQLRYQISKQCLDISDNDIQSLYTEKLNSLQKALLSSGIVNEPLTPTELSLLSSLELDRVIDNSVKNLERAVKIQYLIIGMLYCRADCLQLQPDLSCIPTWLLPDYIEFIFSNNMNFRDLIESTSYFDYIQGWMNYIHDSIFNNLDDQFWQDVASKFAQIANFIPAYFNETNLKDIYVKRAEIIELDLKNNGQVVDYQFPERPASHKKIRLGILASHFNPSAETFATLPIYEYLSRDFEVVLYSLQQTNHPLEQYCRSSANFLVTLPPNLSEQVAQIRSDDLDILFFATNVTAVTNQICLLASHRLARMQITSGGSVVTTGMRHMDYFISGTLTDPPDAQAQYREKLIQLPGAAHCFSYGDFEETSSIIVDRESLGITENAVVFTSGANFYKITSELIHTWAKIIVTVPNSIIILFPFGPNWSSNYPKQAFANHLRSIFSTYGVSADRILTLDPQPIPNREDLKEYLKLADIYLDSYPFAGTTSLIEPLQINLPVIARQGNTFRSSMGAAMIRSLDIADLVADSEESYIQLAIALGTNAELRHQKRAEIKAKMSDNPSFLDSKGYSEKIGKLFTELVDGYAVEKLSDDLRLRDVNWMIFPDWNQSEESVGLELQQVIQTLATQPDSQKTTLLIDTSNIDIEDAQMFLSSIAMNLMMEEDLDITDELEISLIEDLNDIQWATLLPKIDARIVMKCDNQAAVGKLSLSALSQLEIESFMRSNKAFVSN